MQALATLLKLIPKGTCRSTRKLFQNTGHPAFLRWLSGNTFKAMLKREGPVDSSHAETTCLNTNLQLSLDHSSTCGAHSEAAKQRSNEQPLSSTKCNAAPQRASFSRASKTALKPLHDEVSEDHREKNPISSSLHMTTFAAALGAKHGCNSLPVRIERRQLVSGTMRNLFNFNAAVLALPVPALSASHRREP